MLMCGLSAHIKEAKIYIFFLAPVLSDLEVNSSINP
jgi:hypothetical protein